MQHELCSQCSRTVLRLGPQARALALRFTYRKISHQMQLESFWIRFSPSCAEKVHLAKAQPTLNTRHNDALRKCKWNLLLRMGLFALDASNFKRIAGKFACSGPVWIGPKTRWNCRFSQSDFPRLAHQISLWSLNSTLASVHFSSAYSDWRSLCEQLRQARRDDLQRG